MQLISTTMAFEQNSNIRSIAEKEGFEKSGRQVSKPSAPAAGPKT